MLLQLETTNQVFMDTNAYNSLHHTTLPKMARNEKVIMCGFKPLQVFNWLVIINNQLSIVILNTCLGDMPVIATATAFGQLQGFFTGLWIQQSCKYIFHLSLAVV